MPMNARRRLPAGRLKGNLRSNRLGRLRIAGSSRSGWLVVATVKTLTGLADDPRQHSPGDVVRREHHSGFGAEM
jgi:hypothetical protein